MDHETMKKFQFDRRLIRRRGWIQPDVLERELESLPDVAEKAAPMEDEAPAETAADAPSNPDSEAPPSAQ